MKGTVESLEVSVSAPAANPTALVESTSVLISIDGDVTWFTAQWVGPPASTRVCSVLVGGSNPLPPVGETSIRVKLVGANGGTESPILDAGPLYIIN